MSSAETFCAESLLVKTGLQEALGLGLGREAIAGGAVRAVALGSPRAGCVASVMPLVPRWPFLERSIWAGPWQDAGISRLGQAGVPWEERGQGGSRVAAGDSAPLIRCPFRSKLQPFREAGRKVQSLLSIAAAEKPRSCVSAAAPGPSLPQTVGWRETIHSFLTQGQCPPLPH